MVIRATCSAMQHRAHTCVVSSNENWQRKALAPSCKVLDDSQTYNGFGYLDIGLSEKAEDTCEDLIYVYEMLEFGETIEDSVCAAVWGCSVFAFDLDFVHRLKAIHILRKSRQQGSLHQVQSHRFRDPP